MLWGNDFVDLFFKPVSKKFCYHFIANVGEANGPKMVHSTRRVVFWNEGNMGMVKVFYAMSSDEEILYDFNAVFFTISQ